MPKKKKPGRVVAGPKDIKSRDDFSLEVQSPPEDAGKPRAGRQEERPAGGIELPPFGQAQEQSGSGHGEAGERSGRS